MTRKEILKEIHKILIDHTPIDFINTENEKQYLNRLLNELTTKLQQFIYIGGEIQKFHVQVDSFSDIRINIQHDFLTFNFIAYKFDLTDQNWLDLAATEEVVDS